MPICGIYSITNTTNGRVYIGSSEDIEERWRYHRADLVRGSHDNMDIQADYNVNGLSVFVFSVVEECTMDRLVERETLHVMSHGWPCRDTLYNRRLPQGTHCEETKRLMSESGKVKIFTDEHRAKIGMSISKRQLGTKRGPYKKHITENNNE